MIVYVAVVLGWIFFNSLETNLKICVDEIFINLRLCKVWSVQGRLVSLDSYFLSHIEKNTSHFQILVNLQKKTYSISAFFKFRSFFLLEIQLLLFISN